MVLQSIVLGIFFLWGSIQGRGRFTAFGKELGYRFYINTFKLGDGTLSMDVVDGVIYEFRYQYFAFASCTIY